MRRQSLMLVVLCTGVLTILLDATITNAALHLIGEELKFSEASLVWVVNAFMLPFGGFLLLGGRLSDLFGARRVWLSGIAMVTAAALACGLASTRSLFVIGRIGQGLGGAIAVGAALPLLMSMFEEERERARATAIYAVVCAGSGTLGIVLGGVLASMLNWRSLFLAKVPLGLAILLLCAMWLPESAIGRQPRRLDIWGAFTITASCMLAVHVLVNGSQAGWFSIQSVSALSSAGFLFLLFLFIESRVPVPLVPLDLFKVPGFATATTVGVLWAAGATTWIFITPLYMQAMLGYQPAEIGIAFIPAVLITIAFVSGPSARIVARFGVRKPLGIGLALVTFGLALFSRVPVSGTFVADVLPSLMLVALGAAVAFSPLLVVAMKDAGPGETGLFSAVFNTGLTMGSALGLAILVSLSLARTRELLSGGAEVPVALAGGYRLALVSAALCVGSAALIGFGLLAARPRD